MVVMHLPPDRKSLMVDLLQHKCKIKVCEAEHNQSIQSGTVYFAPPDYHLLIETEKRLSLSSEEPVLFSRPSIDVLFETAAEAYDSKLIGVILTGANNDGTKGLKAVIQAGGKALIQDPKTAYASAMPQAAIKENPTAEILNLEEIALYLQKAV